MKTLLFLFCITLVTVSSSAQNCPPQGIGTPWNGPLTITYRIDNGTDCCWAEATYCWRNLANGDPQIAITGVSVETPCGDGFSVNDLINKAHQLAMQDPNNTLNVNIPPCGQGWAPGSVESYVGSCWNYLTFQKNVQNPNGTVSVVTFKSWFICAEIFCIRTCLVCSTGTVDACNPGKTNLVVNCSTTYVPAEPCPPTCNQLQPCN